MTTPSYPLWHRKRQKNSFEVSHEASGWSPKPGNMALSASEITGSNPWPLAAPAFTNVESILDLNDDIDAGQIDVSVQDGSVKLAGTVNAFWKKTEAEKLASIVTGVVGIENDIAVMPSGRVMDQSLAEGIIHSMERDARVDPSSIGIKIEEGMVELKGTVPNRTAHKAALDIVRHSSGVIEIHDDLTIA